MKRCAFLLAALLSACSTTSPGRISTQPTFVAPQATPAEVTSVVGSTNRFAAAMYQQLKAKPGNLAFSPASIAVALNMIRAGARGETAAQMTGALQVQLEQGRADAAFGHLLYGWNFGERPYDLMVVNRLFGEETLVFKQPFLDITGRKYGAQLEPVSFTQNPEKARETINGWLESKTKKRITNLLPEGSIDDFTRLVLTNAIYFKGSWKKAFDESETYPTPFFAPSGEVKVPIMNVTTVGRYAKADSMQMVELPYKGDALAMSVIIPDAKDGLPEIEDKLSHETLSSWLSAAKQRLVTFGLPRFKIDPARGFALREPLMALGITHAFNTQSADFSGIADTSDQPLYISDVFHKAFVEVNEEGTEAAAATGVALKTVSAVTSDLIVKADRPFLFLIRDTKSGMIMFMGRIHNPAG